MPLATHVMARNTKKQVVVLSSDPKGTEFVEWQAADDPTGADVQVVSEGLAQSVPFIRLLQRGIIVIENPEDNPGIQEAIDRQRLAYEKRTNQSSEAAQEAIEETQNNDTVVLACIGPDNRGQGKCGEDVPVREKTKNDKPPLCTKHAALAPQYIPSEEQQGTNNVKTWTRVTMGTPERQQQ